MGSDSWAPQNPVLVTEEHICSEGQKGWSTESVPVDVGQRGSDPHAKQPYVSPEVIEVWKRTAQDLEKIGTEVAYTDFPLVTNYENDSVSREANNVVGAPSNWNQVERGLLIAKAWNAFLEQNGDPDIKSLNDIDDPAMLFSKPEAYVPDTFFEVRNRID